MLIIETGANPFHISKFKHFSKVWFNWNWKICPPPPPSQPVHSVAHLRSLHAHEQPFSTHGNLRDLLLSVSVYSKLSIYFSLPFLVSIVIAALLFGCFEWGVAGCRVVWIVWEHTALFSAGQSDQIWDALSMPLLICTIRWISRPLVAYHHWFLSRWREEGDDKQWQIWKGKRSQKKHEVTQATQIFKITQIFPVSSEKQVVIQNLVD